jgi:glycine betaine/proline transport system ATP-binding protein
VKRFVENVDKSKVLTTHSVLTPVGVVAYPDDDPRTVINQMKAKCLSYLLVIQRDHTLLGVVRIEITNAALERGEKTIANIIESKVPTVTKTAPLTTLIAILAKWPGQVPVVDEKRKLQGIVINNSVIAALAKREIE